MRRVGVGDGSVQVKGDSDPNREDDPGYVMRLVGQVVRVSVATVQIVKALADFR